jgi:hypothetical protein
MHMHVIKEENTRPNQIIKIQLLMTILWTLVLIKSRDSKLWKEKKGLKTIYKKKSFERFYTATVSTTVHISIYLAPVRIITPFAIILRFVLMGEKYIYLPF